MKPDARQYFQGLRRRSLSGEMLSAEEQRALNEYLAEKDAEEMQRLAPQLSAMAAETADYRKRNAQLSVLAERQERLAVRLRQIAEESRVEQEAIHQELRTLIGSVSA